MARPHRRGPERRILVGTSGWSYNHWRGVFYPQGLAASKWLTHYGQYFRSVEINGSFYRLPSERALEQWRDTVPADFVFAIKGSRYITHMKKLKDPREGLKRFLERAALLEDKLGPILFQLPPHWRINMERLAAFLKQLPKGHRYAMEFRDPSWWEPHVYELLARHGVAHCIFDLSGRLSPMEVTTDFVYIRLHGPAGPYQGSYSDEALARWAAHCRRWRRQGRAVYCYFDNDQLGYAAQNALHLHTVITGAKGGARQRRSAAS